MIRKPRLLALVFLFSFISTTHVFAFQNTPIFFDHSTQVENDNQGGSGSSTNDIKSAPSRAVEKFDSAVNGQTSYHLTLSDDDDSDVLSEESAPGKFIVLRDLFSPPHIANLPEPITHFWYFSSHQSAPTVFLLLYPNHAPPVF